MMRAVAMAMLTLYPRAWRERYGEEVADLVASRPAGVRTVLDLVSGAADAWLHHRRGPAAGTLTVPFAAVLACMGAALLLLWNPGLRDTADLVSMRGAWAGAAGAGSIATQLHDLARLLHAGAGAMAVLSVTPLLSACFAARRRSAQDPINRMTARTVIVTAVALVIPVGLVGLGFVSTAYLDVGYPTGPLGEAMVGGFLVPPIMALVLALPMTAADSPAFGAEVRRTGQVLATAAICNTLAWVPVAILLVMGRENVWWSFVGTVTTSALVSVWMAALVARSAIRRGRTVMGRLSPA
ncbi:hypothetical protein [Nonomuraea jabiensis]|uniref:Uncharacterized protein n=1 Tax=Nonomuraea jabiensis TaxID=882448 RepID=A0A7W9LCB7_9ACTN|nr:hypothetical protein [Nonomuraea jabiensis]MBB5778544.1 hypothetical protein [Nonomuraea jabiensis]